MLIPADIQKIKEKATLLFTKEQIDASLDKMAHAINEKLDDSNPVVLCVMVGGLIPAGNLLPRLTFPLELDYIHATRYLNETCAGTPEVKMVAKPRIPLKDRNVLIIEDILDEGLTLAATVDYCQQQGARSVHTAILLDKKGVARLSRGTDSADFTALSMDKGYVFGYGLDYHGYLRNVSGIYVVTPEKTSS